MDIVKTLPTVISIHAPTRGATTTKNLQKNLSVFQSTLPRGERLSYGLVIFKTEYFNPRSHEGSDDIHLVAPVVTILFQSTLPRGERHSRK